MMEVLAVGCSCSSCLCWWLPFAVIAWGCDVVDLSLNDSLASDFIPTKIYASSPGWIHVFSRFATTTILQQIDLIDLSNVGERRWHLLWKGRIAAGCCCCVVVVVSCAEWQVRQAYSGGGGTRGLSLSSPTLSLLSSKCVIGKLNNINNHNLLIWGKLVDYLTKYLKKAAGMLAKRGPKT